MVTRNKKAIVQNKLNRWVVRRLPASEKQGHGQAARPISTGKLSALLHLHLRPINLVVSEGPLAAEAGDTSSLGGLRA